MRKWVMVLAAVALAASNIGCINKLRARDHLNKGVRAFTSRSVSRCGREFSNRLWSFDPGFVTARAYLATAYMQQYIPGAESRRITKMAQAAFDNFQKGSRHRAEQHAGHRLIASLNLNQKKVDEAQQWNEKLVAIDPKNADAYTAWASSPGRGVPGLWDGAGQRRHEAGRPGSRSRIKRSRKS